jgi:hypothetical protein
MAGCSEEAKGYVSGMNSESELHSEILNRDIYKIEIELHLDQLICGANKLKLYIKLGLESQTELQQHKQSTIVKLLYHNVFPSCIDISE